VEQNFGKYNVINVRRAKQNEKGKFVFEKHMDFCISNYEIDTNELANFKNFHDNNML